MRSFRLDPDSVDQFLRSWPVILIAGSIVAALAFVANEHRWVKLLIPPLMGVCFGPRLLVGKLREQYPTGRHLWLLSIGMTTVLVGVALRMTFHAWQGSTFDLTWLGISFFSILAFVLLNRGNKDVIK